MGLLSIAKDHVKRITTDSVDSTLNDASTHSVANATRKKKDSDNFYPVQVGDVYHNGRYVVQGHLGSGRYASVWLVKDINLNDYFALKVLNSDFYNGHFQLFELEVMERIAEVSSTSSHPGKDHVAQMKNHFDLHSASGRHVCMVFELLGASIASQATQTQIQRLPCRAVKQITRQTLEALDFIHTECGVIHTDISPSNICIELPDHFRSAVAATADASGNIQLQTPSLMEERAIKVRLNDFGIACFVERHLTDKISPPLLRAPEVTLGAPWDPKVDIFNLGALMFQFLTGQLPFPGKGERNRAGCAESDRLAQLIKSFGGEPDLVLENADRAGEFAKKGVDLQEELTSGGVASLERCVAEHATGSNAAMDLPSREVGAVCDLLRRMLATDPRVREPARSLLRQPWLEPVGIGRQYRRL